MEKNTEKIIKNLTKYFIFYPIDCNNSKKEYIKNTILQSSIKLINRKNTMRLFFRLFITFLLICNTANAYSHPKGLYTLEYPVNMPNISLISENNEPTSILENPSDLTIFIFWSQNCFPCLREMKSIERFYPKAQTDNIKVILVSSSSEWNSTQEERAFLTKYKAPTVPFFNDIDNKLSLSLGIGSTPYTVIMNKQGKKVATIQGEVNWNSKKLYQQIKALIK